MHRASCLLHADDNASTVKGTSPGLHFPISSLINIHISTTYYSVGHSSHLAEPDFIVITLVVELCLSFGQRSGLGDPNINIYRITSASILYLNRL